MFKRIRNFKFQGLVMELTLVVVNVMLVLSLIYFWSSYFQNKQANNADKEFENIYVRVEEGTQGSK